MPPISDIHRHGGRLRRITAGKDPRCVFACNRWPRVVTFGQRSSQFKLASKVFGLNVFAQDRFCSRLWQLTLFANALGSNQTAVWKLAGACSDGAATVAFVRAHSSRKARKRLCYHQRGGVESALLPTKSSSAPGKRGWRFLRDLRDYPSHLDVIPGGCTALAGVVRIQNDRAFHPFHFYCRLAAACGISVARASR